MTVLHGYHTTGRLLPFGATGVKAVNQEFRLEALFLAVGRLTLSSNALLAILKDDQPANCN